MKARHGWSLVGAGILTVMTLACGEAVTGPQLVPLGGEAEALARLTAFDGPVTRSAWIGPEGGTLESEGVALRIPAGALDRRERIEMTVPRGGHVQARFKPHGLRFESPVELEFSLVGTAAEGDPVRAASLVGVYFLEEILPGLVRVLETVPTRVEGEALILEIKHFSGYTPAGG